jgi:hypothetical protein
LSTDYPMLGSIVFGPGPYPLSSAMNVPQPSVKLAALDYDRCVVVVNGVRYELRRDCRDDLTGEALKCFDDDAKPEAPVGD